jgi:hypothetical protein
MPQVKAIPTHHGWLFCFLRVVSNRPAVRGPEKGNGFRVMYGLSQFEKKKLASKKEGIKYAILQEYQLISGLICFGFVLAFTLCRGCEPEGWSDCFRYGAFRI